MRPSKEIAGAHIALYAIEAAELTGDGELDIVITRGSGGNGLAAGNAWRTLFLSTLTGTRRATSAYY